METNVAEFNSVESMVSQTLDVYGIPDVLINNAGINVFGEPLNMPDSEWKRAFSVDLDGVWFGCKAVLPHMLKKNKGSIVNVASVHGIQIIPNCFPYPVAKHGVIGLTKALAVDYAAKGIKIMPNLQKTYYLNIFLILFLLSYDCVYQKSQQYQKNQMLCTLVI